MGQSTLPPHDHGVVVARFIDACLADDRIVAAFLAGSRARGEADEFSDLDLGVVTTDEAFGNATGDREAFIRQFGEPLFLESFGNDRIVFFILADGTEGELFFGREGALEEIDVGLFEPLVDRRGILASAEFPFAHPDPEQQRESLRQVLNWFWHDLSHFIAALGRGDLWWANGQLEALRRHCVNLVRIEHGVEAQDEAYEKLETVDSGIRGGGVVVDHLFDGAAGDVTSRPRHRDLLPGARPSRGQSQRIRVPGGARPTDVRPPRKAGPRVT